MQKVCINWYAFNKVKIEYVLASKCIIVFINKIINIFIFILYFIYFKLFTNKYIQLLNFMLLL